MSAPPASDISCIPSMQSTMKNSKQKQHLPHSPPKNEEVPPEVYFHLTCSPNKLQSTAATSKDWHYRNSNVTRYGSQGAHGSLTSAVIAEEGILCRFWICDLPTTNFYTPISLPWPSQGVCRGRAFYFQCNRWLLNKRYSCWKKKTKPNQPQSIIKLEVTSLL